MSGRMQAIVIDPADNVATAIQDLKAGDAAVTPRGEIVLVRNIPFGHKFALIDINPGEYVIKYGAQIGRATVSIAQGDHVHVHNVEDVVDEVRKTV